MNANYLPGILSLPKSSGDRRVSKRNTIPYTSLDCSETEKGDNEAIIRCEAIVNDFLT